MSKRNYRAKRSKFLIIAGVGAIPFGFHLFTTPSALVEESLHWLYGAFDSNEIGILWILAGILAMTSGIITYIPSTKTAKPRILETIGFAAIFFVSFLLVVIEVIAWILFDINALAVIALGVTISLTTLNASTWDNPRTPSRERELTPTGLTNLPEDLRND